MVTWGVWDIHLITPPSQTLKLLNECQRLHLIWPWLKIPFAFCSFGFRVYQLSQYCVLLNETNQWLTWLRTEYSLTMANFLQSLKKTVIIIISNEPCNLCWKFYWYITKEHLQNMLITGSCKLRDAFSNNLSLHVFWNEFF